MHVGAGVPAEAARLYVSNEDGHSVTVLDTDTDAHDRDDRSRQAAARDEAQSRRIAAVRRGERAAEVSADRTR